MYAEHAPGQLTRAQRKELEDTAIERGGEVEYDPGQAWIRQPPPRYSFTAHAPKWSGNTTAIRGLRVNALIVRTRWDSSSAVAATTTTRVGEGWRAASSEPAATISTVAGVAATMRDMSGASASSV